jgi:hypothetical protein
LSTTSPHFEPLRTDEHERRVGITDEAYLALFLEQADVESGMERIQDTRHQGPDRDDGEFAYNQGIACGFAVWQGAADQPISRLVDIRFVFPTCWQASSYHAARLLANSEGWPRVEAAPEVGDECFVFGGTGDRLGLGVAMTNFYYVFRIGRVVVKLYMMQGLESGEPLTPEIAARVGRRVASRIVRAHPV